MHGHEPGQSGVHTINVEVYFMAYRNIVVINSKKVDLNTLTKKERERLAEAWNRRAAACVNYEEDKTA